VFAKNIRKANISASVQHRVRCCNKCQRGNNHFIATPDAECKAGKVQRNGRVRDGKRMLDTQERRELFFKLLRHLPHR